MSADTVTPPPATPAPPKRRKWAKRLLPLATLLVLVAWFSPAVVAKTELRNRFARQALADLRGNVNVGSASLGWLSPVELRDVTVTDEAGRALVRIPKVTSQKALYALARNAADPGEFVVDGATISVVCEKGTTNLETAFAEYLKDDGKPPSDARTPVSVRVTNATVTLTDAETNTTTRIDGVAATANVPARRAEPITAHATAATGKLDAQVSLGTANTAKLVANSFPLDTLSPLVKRARADVRVAGLMNADVKVNWSAEPSGALKLAASGTVGVKSLAVGAAALNGDTLQLDSAELPLDVELAGRAVRVRKFDLTCDVGTLSVAGAFDPTEAPDAVFTRAGVVVGADVELAKLAAKLPKLLRVKDGTELREGKLKVDVASKSDGTGVAWTGTVRASAIKATRDGKAVTWDEPLNVEFVGRYAPGALPTFDKLVCTSDFLAVNARTTPNTIQVAATVYLHKLGAKLHEFLDLGGFSIAGEATAGLGAGREADGKFSAVGTLELKGFAYTDRGGKGLNEPAAKATLSAAGVAPEGGPVRINAASLTVDVAGDELRLKLLEPLADARQYATASVDVSLKGDVARWQARAAAVAPVPDWQMSGNVIAGGKGKYANERVTIDRLTVNWTNAKFRGLGVVLNEPAMNAVADLTVNPQTGVATFAKLTLNAAPLTINDGTLTFEPQPNGDVHSIGSGPCVADLNRVAVALELYPTLDSPNAFHGRGVGPVRFRYTGDRTAFGGTLDVTNFGYGPKDKLIWAEPTLKLETDGDYTFATSTVSFAMAKASRPGLDLDMKGAIAKATTTQDVNLSGTVRYDWAKLTPRAREFVGPTFAATGTGERAITVTGTLNPQGAVTVAAVPPKVELKAPGAPAAQPAGPGVLAAVSGEAAIGWDSIKAYGFEIGAHELKAKVTRGVVNVTPVYAAFGGGRVVIAPTLYFDRQPAEMVLAQGHVLDRAKLTPAATASALGYALPAIANAGQAEGEISYIVADNRIRLDDYTKSTITSAVVIHKATVGATPTVAEIAKLLGVKNTTMTLATDNAVPVQVKDGRVFHQGFEMNLAGTPLRTNGSVGFDNTLDLIVEVPLPKDLPALKNNPLLMKALSGKWVKVPVKGTLSKPEIDAKGFERTIADMAREGAKEVGKEAVENELKKLFPNMGVPGANPKLPFPLPLPKK